MKKSLAVIIGFCLVVTTVLSFNLFSCFGAKEKEFTYGDDFSITLTSNFKSRAFDADDFESDDPVTQGQMFKYYNSTDGILVVGARAAKEDCKKFNAFDLNGFVIMIKELYGSSKSKVTYVDDDEAYFAEFYFTYGDGLLQYETCYEDEKYFYEISYSMESQDYHGGYKDTVRSYARTVKSSYSIGKYDSVKASSFECDGITVAIDDTFTLDETEAFYTNGVMEISAKSILLNDEEEQVTVSSLAQMEEFYEALMEEALIFNHAKTNDNVDFSYATIGDEETGMYTALYVFDGVGYIVTYTVEYDYFDWFYDTMHSFAKGVQKTAA